MSLIRLLFRSHRAFIALALLLSLSSAAIGVAMIAYVDRLLAQVGDVRGLAGFAALLVALFVFGSAAQLAMSTLGHKVVYRLRQTMVKRVLDTDVERLEAVGLARILATLNGDINTITLAFASLPSVVYGVTLTVGGFAYLAWLSLPLFAATALMIAAAVGCSIVLMARTRREARLARDMEDHLYRHYQSVVEGRKELALNRDRARSVYEHEFEPDARRSRDHEIRTDIYNGLNQNWINTILLATIGLAFFLVGHLGWASAGTAATFAFALMFLRTPMAGMVGSVPSLIAGSVALAKVDSLQLAPHREGFGEDEAALPADWSRLQLRGAAYRYAAAAADEAGFGVGPIDLSLHRGELLFVIGGNGSGKSTLMRVLSGLYRPQQGALWLDDTEIDAARTPALRRLFATVFSDFHLFNRVLGPDGAAIGDERAQALLSRLELAHKVSVGAGVLSDTRLSQGQRKRLALLLAWAEQRPILLLDEWAADQDPGFRRFFYEQLLPELRAAGKTIVAVSHDDRYFHLADRVLKLDGGQLIEHDGDAGLGGRTAHARAQALG